MSAAVEELLVAAQRQDRLTVGVYESAKLMNVSQTLSPGWARVGTSPLCNLPPALLSCMGLGHPQVSPLWIGDLFCPFFFF